MPRLPCYVLPGQPQHVIAALVGPSTCGTCASMHIARGNNRCPIFIADEDYGCFRHHLQEACTRPLTRGGDRRSLEFHKHRARLQQVSIESDPFERVILLNGTTMGTMSYICDARED